MQNKFTENVFLANFWVFTQHIRTITNMEYHFRELTTTKLPIHHLDVLTILPLFFQDLQNTCNSEH